MLERPSDVHGDDLAARPDVALLQTVARTLNRRFALHVARDTCPFIGAVGAEMNRGVCDRVLVGGDKPGILAITVGVTEVCVGVGKTDVFGGRFGQFDGFCQI